MPVESALVRERAREASLTRARSEMIADATLSDQERILLETVPLDLHPSDGMFIRTRARHYLGVGLSAVRCIDAAIDAVSEQPSKQPRLRSILDMGCGYGRVTRFLRVRFPQAKLAACEIDPNAVAFCRRAFSASGVLSNESFAELQLPASFDLIWCGSLVTHLDARATALLLRLFYRHLAPEGLCVFTSHGASTIHSIESGHRTYQLTSEGQRRIVAGYRKIGYGYADYADTSGYGVSALSPSGIAALTHPGDHWRHALFLERGWDNHQDVHAWRRQGRASVRDTIGAASRHITGLLRVGG